MSPLSLAFPPTHGVGNDNHS